MKITEITETHVSKMSELTEEILSAGGKLMLCLDKLSHEMYGERMSRKDPKEEEMMHERRMNMRYRDYDDDMWNERRYGNRYR